MRPIRKFRLQIGTGQRLALLTGATVLVAVMPAAAQAPGLALLDGLEKGAWELRYRDGTPARRLCLRTGRELVQLRHAGPTCGRYVVEDGLNQVTVQYTCKGDGYGRTRIRKETPTLVQLDSQGVVGGSPFAFSAEARRVGGC